MAHRALRVLTPDYLSSSSLTPPTSHTRSSNHTWTHHSVPTTNLHLLLWSPVQGVASPPGQLPKSHSGVTLASPLSLTAPPLLSPSPAQSTSIIFSKLVRFYPHCSHPSWDYEQLSIGLLQHCDSFIAGLAYLLSESQLISSFQPEWSIRKKDLIICLCFLELFYNLDLASSRKPSWCASVAPVFLPLE